MSTAPNAGATGAGTPEAPFFVGYLNAVPRPLAQFLFVVSAVFVGVMVAVAFALSANVDDPGDGRFLWGAGYQNLSGVIETRPYPLLRLPGDAESGPRTILLSGQGKRGVQAGAGPLDGQLADAGGIFLQRGSITMLQVGGRNGKPGLRPAEDETFAYTPAARVPLGRWRLTGEICDGKCYTGAMRPGRGLAHKACANLCILGGVPPVFVSTSPVNGAEFFLLAGPDGGPLDTDMLDYTALFIEVEGMIERADDLHIFTIDPATLRVR